MTKAATFAHGTTRTRHSWASSAANRCRHLDNAFSAKPKLDLFSIYATALAFSAVLQRCMPFDMLTPIPKLLFNICYLKILHVHN